MVITRARSDSETIRSSLEAEGATVLALPALEIAAPQNSAPLDEALRCLSSYHWIAFTSRNAVRAVFERLSVLDLAPVLPPDLRVAAVGRSTAAELETHGTAPEFLASESTSAALADALVARGVEGARILLPVGDLARPDLRTRLEGAGARVDQLVAYRTVQPAEVDTASLDALRRGEAHVLALASPSAFRNLIDMLNDDGRRGASDTLPASRTSASSEGAPTCLRRIRIACIGPTTAAAVRELDLEPAIVAQSQSVDSLVEAIVELYTSEKPLGHP